MIEVDYLLINNIYADTKLLCFFGTTKDLDININIEQTTKDIINTINTMIFTGKSKYTC